MKLFGRKLSTLSLAAAAAVAGGSGIGYSTVTDDLDRQAKLDRIMSSAVLYDDPAKADELEGRIVIATGTATPSVELKDPVFNLSAPALSLARDTQIYQWNATGTKIKTYEKVWSEEPIDSTFFDGMHANTGRMSYPDVELAAETVELVANGRRLAALDPAFREFIGGAVKMMLTTEQYRQMPSDVRLRFDLVNGSLVEKAAAAGNPQIGDNRTRFFTVPPYEVTVVGMLLKGRIMAADTSSEPIGILRQGRLTSEEIEAAVSDDITSDYAGSMLAAMVLSIAGIGMFRSDFRNAPRVTRPLKLGR